MLRKPIFNKFIGKFNKKMLTSNIINLWPIFCLTFVPFINRFIEIKSSKLIYC